MGEECTLQGVDVLTLGRSIPKTNVESQNSAVRDYPVVLNIDGACAPAPR